MTEDPRSDLVNRQYERWVYPDPIVDLPAWTERSWEYFDPSHAHRILWPDREYRPDMDILIAGCGTNQAACFAYNNPQASVVAVDISEFLPRASALFKGEEPAGQPRASSAADRGTGHAEPRFRPHRLHRRPASHGRPAGGDEGARRTGPSGRRNRHHAIREVWPLRGRGVAGGVPRYGSAPGRGVAAERCERCCRDWVPDHPIQGYLRIAPDLNYDAGLVDTFLHGRDRSFSVDDCMDLVSGAGLVFQTWHIKSPYYTHEFFEPPNDFFAAINQTSRGRSGGRSWSASTRPTPVTSSWRRRGIPAEENYTIDFSTTASLDYVPTDAQGMRDGGRRHLSARTGA